MFEATTRAERIPGKRWGSFKEYMGKWFKDNDGSRKVEFCDLSRKVYVDTQPLGKLTDSEFMWTAGADNVSEPIKLAVVEALKVA